MCGGWGELPTRSAQEQRRDKILAAVIVLVLAGAIAIMLLVAR